MTRTRKPHLYLRHDEASSEWWIIERDRHGHESLLATYDNLEAAQAAAKSLRGSAVPRLSLLFPFGPKGRVR